MDDTTTDTQAGPVRPAPVRADGGAAPWGAMAVVGIAQLMVMLDSTVVNVALPSIGAQLPAGTAALQWTVSSYVLMYGSLLLLGGRAADVFGRRRTFLTGLTLFGAASVLCGAAPNSVVLLTGRVAQGIGAALLSAAALSAVLAIYQIPAQRKVALTAWSGLGVLGATIGVVLGGLLTTTLSWRWAFLINVPISLVVAVAAFRVVPPLAATSRRPLRLPVALLASAGLAALLYGLIRLQDGLGDPLAWGSIALAVVLLFILTMLQVGAADPLLPLRLLRLPTYALASVGLLLAAAVMIGSTYLASGYFQRAHDLSAFDTGLALLPMGVSSLVVAVLVPKLADGLGFGRLYLAGAAAQLVGALILVLATDSGIVAGVALAIIGAGLPSSFVSLYNIGASHVTQADSGVGSGLLNTFNQTGAALGIAAAGTTAAAVAAASVRDGATTAQASLDSTGAGFTVLAACAAVAMVIAAVLIRLTRQPQEAA